MRQKRHTLDQVTTELRRADVLLGKGAKVPEVCKQLEITEQTYDRWRQKVVWIHWQLMMLRQDGSMTR